MTLSIIPFLKDPKVPVILVVPIEVDIEFIDIILSKFAVPPVILFVESLLKLPVLPVNDPKTFIFLKDPSTPVIENKLTVFIVIAPVIFAVPPTNKFPVIVKLPLLNSTESVLSYLIILFVVVSVNES